MKITLISPPLGDRVEHPLGLLYLASSLEKGGYSVDVIDLNYVVKEDPNISPFKIIDIIKNTHPDILGFTSLSVSIGFAINLAKHCKEQLNVPIIFGGPHVSFIAKEILSAFNWIDFIIKHEGERTVVDLIDAISKGKEIKSINGVAFRKDNQIIETEPRNLNENIDEFPFPAYDLVPSPTEYTRLRNKYNPEKELEIGANILSSRGCTFSCTYCNVSLMWWRKFRFRSPKNVIEEVRVLKEKRVKFLIFNDDEFTINKRRVIELCEQLKKEDLSWSCFSRVDTIDNELLNIMKNSGCYEIFYGIESGSEKILKLMNKQATPKKAFDIVKATINAGIKPFASFMCGFPGEDFKDLKKTAFIAERFANVGVKSQCCFLAPFPGTELYNSYKKSLEKLPFTPNYLHLNKDLNNFFNKNLDE